MRLHALELAAIGPFATPQHIDFDQLQASGLFLLDGPTGAGKTTVLDAITFALYGPGENRGDGRLHSDFAAHSAEPFVRLEFSLRGVRHRVTRTPEYERPKRRGDGMTTEHASAHLERFERGAWVSRSSNKAEIAEMLEDEIGLNREQFHQVVLLPQGEFASFLRAKDDERRGVLSRLFGTGLYERLTDELDARRQEASRSLTAAQARIADCVSAAAEAAGLDAAGRDELAGVSEAERGERLGVIATQLADAARAAIADERRTRRAQAEARKQADAAGAAADALVRFSAARAELDDHLAKSQRVDIGRGRLATALRAEPVRPLLGAVADAERALAAARRAAGTAERASAEAALDQARAAIQAGELAHARRTGLVERHGAARRVADLEPRLAAADALRADAVDAQQRAADRHLELVEARLAGMAAELAGRLADGDACPVCGSSEHPQPATDGPAPVDASLVAAALEQRTRTEQERSAAERRVAELQAELEAARAVAQDRAQAELESDLADVDAIVAAGTTARAALPGLDKTLVAITAHEAAGAAAAAARERATTEALAAGFDSLDAAGAAVLSPDVRADLEHRISTWESRTAELRAALTVPDFAAFTSLPHHEVETQAVDRDAEAHRAAAALTAAEAAHADALAARDRAARAVERFGARVAEVDDAVASHAALADEVEPVIHLARLARGMAGHRRVALTTYVLRHWFEHVVAAANVRLASISAGRYSLVRVDEGESKHERVGLTLHVVDAHTGEARSPRSLSGGETFYTSLALALGLADVVKSEAGGVDLDTLFIDEGFGTLDAETLEQVMSVIDELRDRGRVVGIVSHVADLKERIPERLEVRRLPDGSSTLRVVA